MFKRKGGDVFTMEHVIGLFSDVCRISILSSITIMLIHIFYIKKIGEKT